MRRREVVERILPEQRRRVERLAAEAAGGSAAAKVDLRKAERYLAWLGRHVAYIDGRMALDERHHRRGR